MLNKRDCLVVLCAAFVRWYRWCTALLYRTALYCLVWLCTVYCVVSVLCQVGLDITDFYRAEEQNCYLPTDRQHKNKSHF